MTDAELAEIEARAARATAGPWKWREDQFLPRYMRQVKGTDKWVARKGSSARKSWVHLLTGPTGNPDRDFDDLIARGAIDEWDFAHVLALRWDKVKGDSIVNGSPSPSDKEFIAHARTDVPALVAEVRRLREREAALEKVVALAECGPPMHRFPVAPPIIGFTDNEGPIYPPGYDPTRHAEDCTGCKFDAARAALAALDAKEKPHD